jgi:hypothetical protein
MTGQRLSRLLEVAEYGIVNPGEYHINKLSFTAFPGRTIVFDSGPKSTVPNAREDMRRGCVVLVVFLQNGNNSDNILEVFTPHYHLRRIEPQTPK